MLPPVGSDTIVTDAQGRRIRIKVEYVDGKVEAPPRSLQPKYAASLPVLTEIPKEIPKPPEAPRELHTAPAVTAAVPPVPGAPPAPTLLVAKTEGDRPKVAPAPPVKVVYDHERVGGKFTVCVLLYGDYFDMHKRCLTAITRTCPRDRIDLRVGSNQLGARSLDLVQGLGRDGLVRVHYAHKTNEKKYPVMRKMFRDPDAPIATKWLIWFDDDSMCDKNPDWLALLAQQIVNYPTADMFGPVRFYRLTEQQPKWVREAPWFRGRPFRDKGGRPQPNGDKVHFAVGAFWALRTEAMIKCDIPCQRLGHNGGDWTIGEQLYQGGFNLKNWTGDKGIVEWSAVPRRGLSETHPGTAGKKH